MKRIVALLAVIAAGFAGAVVAAAPPSYSATVCQAGRHGDHPAGADLDGDGVPDSEDWCPNSAAGASVGPNGCLAGQLEVSCGPVPPDATPRVVRAAAIDEPDTDGDGVADADDRCPGTPRGAEVDANGCVKIEKVVLKGVNFATGSATLLPAAGDTLRTVAEAMKANPKIQVEVGGHTDSVGSESANQRLSERRADSVRDFLVREGVDASRLTTRGYGESTPVDTNDTADGRSNNRRVAFRVTRS
jgi:OmpA-OmpF porin, OOP family